MCCHVSLSLVVMLAMAATYILFRNFTIATELEQMRSEFLTCNKRTDNSIKTCHEDTHLAQILIRDLTEEIDKLQEETDTLMTELRNMGVEKQMGEQLAATVVDLTIQEDSLQQDIVSKQDRLQDTISRIQPLKEANENLRNTIAQTVVI